MVHERDLRAQNEKSRYKRNRLILKDIRKDVLGSRRRYIEAKN